MYCSIVLFFFKQKTAYEMRISDWSSDVCSSDLVLGATCRNCLTSSRLSVSVWVTPANLSDVVPSASRISVTNDCTWGTTALRSRTALRSDEHRSELQSLMRISYAAFCLKTKTISTEQNNVSVETLKY